MLQFASLRSSATGAFNRSTISDTICSNFDLVNSNVKCFGPVVSAVMNGKFILYVGVVDKAHFAFSASSIIRCIAIESLDKSIVSSFLNSSTIHFAIALSKSHPPR